MERIKYVFNIALVALLFLAVAINKNGRILGHTTQELFHSSSSVVDDISPETTLFDGTRVIHSLPLAKDVVGFSGRTPVTVYIKDGVVQSIEADENEETLSFFNKVLKSGLLNSWNGKSLQEAVDVKCDVVSGATYSSVAVIENVHRAIAYAASVEPASKGFKLFDLKTLVGMLVILIGVFFTLRRPQHKWMEVAYMILNVAVLGFWSASFLSIAQFVSWMSNGFTFSLTLMLLVVVVLTPIFGRKGSYCHLHCPMGSAQELLNRVGLPQIKFSSKVNQILNKTRYYILVILLLSMWIGIGFDLMDYEIFSAFLLSSASNVVLVMAAIFIVLSLFIKRPYCRFVCPTGALITTMQKTKA